MRLQFREITCGSFTGRIADAGSGSPIVLLASMLVLGRSYTWLVRSLARDHRVIVVELPGTGKATKLVSPWSFEQYAQWVIDLLAQLDLARITLVGHSNSGPVAMLASIADPRRIARLVMVDPVGADPSRSLLWVVLGRGLDAILELKLTLWGFHHVIYNAIFHFRNFVNQVWLSGTSNILREARKVRVPTLICWGQRDHTMPLSFAFILSEHIPGAAVQISRTGSHDWLITHADEFTAAVAAFIRTPNPSPTLRRMGTCSPPMVRCSAKPSSGPPQGQI